jgi:hypothetical protein
MLRPFEGCIAWNLGRFVHGTVRVLGLFHRLEGEYRTEFESSFLLVRYTMF